MSDDDTTGGIVLAPEDLSAGALRGLIEEFVTRDGTDYGDAEASLERKIADVRGELARGEARIVFDPETGTANIAPVRDLPR